MASCLHFRGNFWGIAYFIKHDMQWWLYFALIKSSQESTNEDHRLANLGWINQRKIDFKQSISILFKTVPYFYYVLFGATIHCNWCSPSSLFSHIENVNNNRFVSIVIIQSLDEKVKILQFPDQGGQAVVWWWVLPGSIHRDSRHHPRHSLSHATSPGGSEAEKEKVIITFWQVV